MKRHNDKHIADALDGWLHKKTKLTAKRHLHKLREQWPVIMGQAIGDMTDKIDLQGTTLHLRLNSSALRQELNQNQQLLLKKVNEILGEENLVDRVTFS